MIRFYCDGCDVQIEEIQTFDWVAVNAVWGWGHELRKIHDDEVAIWCSACKEKKDRVFLIMKAKEVSAKEQIGIDGKALLKSEMGKDG